jgi:hypothetical protein
MPSVPATLSGVYVGQISIVRDCFKAIVLMLMSMKLEC